MRIGDWSSDVCSSDLADIGARQQARLHIACIARERDLANASQALDGAGILGDASEVDPAGAQAARHQPHVHQFQGVIGNVAEGAPIFRSEEHTSELLSLMRLSYAVLCLQQTNTSNAVNKQSIFTELN